MLKDQRSCSPGRNVQEKARRKRRNRRSKKSLSNIKGDADVKSEDAEENKMEVVETSSVQTQTRVPVETQHVELQEEDNLQRHKDAKMTNAQTQTRKPKGEQKFTQTPVVFLCSQETQTDFHVAEQDDASEGKREDGEKNAAESQLTEDKRRADNSAQTQVTQNEDNSGAQKKEDPPAGGSGDPTDSQSEKGAESKSYAKVVSGEGAGERQSKMDASEAADKTMKPSQNLS